MSSHLQELRCFVARGLESAFQSGLGELLSATSLRLLDVPRRLDRQIVKGFVNWVPTSARCEFPTSSFEGAQATSES